MNVAHHPIARLARAALLWAGLALLATTPARAQSTVPAKGAPFTLQGTTLDGRPVSTASLQGKVLLVFFWSTDCAVCRNKMPELRANYLGWRGKPFEMVTVSVDRSRSDVLAYEQAVLAIVPQPVQFPALWAGDPGYRDSLGAKPRRLPLSLLIDTKGRVSAIYEGRIPAEAWDDIADLMP